MRNSFFILIAILSFYSSSAQCITGDCKNGHGFLRTKDNIQYEGGFKNGKFHGFGDYYDYTNKYSYKGNWVNGKKSGFGIEEDYTNNTKYEGEWKNDAYHGKGKFTWQGQLDLNYEEYDGEWKDGKRTGIGTYKWKDGNIYKGGFFENLLQGKGKFTWISGNYYEGELINNLFDGEGEMHYADGTVEKGIFKGDSLFEGETLYKENNLSFTAFSGDTNATLIIDAAAVIDDNTKKIISDLLWSEYHKTSNTVMVFTIPTLNGESIEDYANKTFNRLQLGTAGKNNGVLLLIAVNDRKMQMEVGYGLEGVLPDLLTQRIQQQDIIPDFKNGNISQGILKGVKGILSVLQDPKNAELYASDSSSDENGRTDITMYVLNLLILLACINSAYFGQYGRFVFSSIIMLWFSLIITYKDQYGLGFSNSFLLHTIIYYLIYFTIRGFKAGKIKTSKKESFIHQFFYNNSEKYETSSGGSGGSYSSSGYSGSSSSSYSSSSSSSSWSGGGSSGGGGSSSSW
ncbi:MAG: TPM domain-containing protein [Bacteroidetes bacterium]|nr:TPM domain-containing protein [Bacteroidota bacterium]